MDIFYKDSIETFTFLMEEGIKTGTFKNIETDKVARTIYFLFIGVFFTSFSVNVDYNLIDQHTFQIDRIINSIKN